MNKLTEGIFFKSPEHEQRFMEAVQGHIHDGELDPYYGSALYILTASHHGWSSVKGWVSDDVIDFEDMLKHVDLTGGTDVLYHLARNLFNGGEFRGPAEFKRLDDGNYRVAMQAINIRCQR